MKTATILLLFIATSESSFSKRWNTVRPGSPAYAPRVGKSFFACNEVARVTPPPNSLLACAQTGICEFLIEFVRPVRNILDFQDRWWLPNVRKLAKSIDSSGRHAVFLVPDPLNYDMRLHPHDLSFADSHGKVLSVLFDFKSASGNLTALRRSMRSVFLVVDGGWYYSSMEEFVFPYHAFVPLSVFGEYFLVEEEVKGRVPAPLPRSYCQDPVSPRKVERRPMNEEDVSIADSLLITLDTKGHYLERSQDFLVAQISVVAEGWGNASMILPAAVDVLFEGKRVTVALPAGEINMERGYGQIRIPVKRELLYNLRERVFHHASPKMVPLTHQPTFYKPDKHFPSYRLIRGESIEGRGANVRSSCVEFYDPTLQLKIAEYITLDSKEDHAPNALNQTDYVLLKHMEDIDWRRQLLLSRAASAFSPHYFEGHQAVFPTRRDYTECHLCPSNSRRSLGRGGLVYHCAELGTFYNLLTPMEDSQWSTSHTLNVAVTIGGRAHSTYLTTSDRIPSTLKEAVRRFGVLVPPLGPWGSPGGQGTADPIIYHDLEDAIYVPIGVAHRQQGCGSLELYRYPKNFSSSLHFCESSFGDCIGEPFHSPKRFPVVPPFGLADLAGPIPTHQWSQLSSEQRSHLNGAHPSPSGGQRSSVVPRAVLKLANPRKEDGTMVLSYSPRQAFIGHISVPGVKVLEPSLSFKPWQFVTSEVRTLAEEDSCSGIWKLQPLLHNTSHETEAILSASVINRGEGGASIVFEAKCTSQLIVTPSSGKQMVWVPPHSTTTVSFHLNAIKTSNFIAVHTCHLSITMEAISLFSNHRAPAPLCTKQIRTFGGAFEDPCSLAGTKPHNVEALYYVLPPEQRESSQAPLRQYFTSPGGRGLTLIRAITLVLRISQDEEMTLPSLYEERVSCGHHDVIVLHEDQLFHEALLSRRSPDHKRPNNITFSSNFLLPRRLFYFGGREWTRDQGTKHPKPSGCRVEVWVRSKPFPCKHIVKSLEMFIPLTAGDVEAIKKASQTSGRYWFLSAVYGDQREEVLVAMATLVLCSIIMIAFIGTGQGIMYILRNSIPSAGTLRYLERRLEEARQDEKRRWENPEIFLSSDQQGPFYRLYDFRATASFDTASLRRLRIAGTLKYKDRELQVVFGHISKVYIDDTKKSCDLWVEASSGMYLLEYSNVDPEYKDILTGYLNKYGIACP